ncbi:hypothetical protein [Haloarcula sebkhae]|uniref:Uncharacterized protein n=2 Tax=Haloarcula sebkhae TaxID=932660 RepID=A0ACC6VIJ7_9EURY|nr:hypothetical protein [Haloarcula sebkhae]GGK74554.1 hypothetical protein GCM10009067_28450 [Haloarcula sebkhae]
MTGFCEENDVRKALQDKDLSETDVYGPTGTEFVTAAIEKVSDWLQRQGNRYWYDSGGGTDLVPDSPATVSDVRLDIPSSPHSQRDQLFHDSDTRYPVTKAGPYARVTLPHGYVQSLTGLEVRGRGGGVEDWVAANDKTEGRGEDYYVARKGQDSYGRTHLYVRARSIGPRYDFNGILTAEFDYGLDATDESWQDVRRGVAQLAAAELVIEDDVVTSIPDNGQLVGVDTQRQQLVDDGRDALEPYLTPPGGG